MGRIIKIATQIIWTVSMLGICTVICGTYGWAHHGWLGALVLGTIGFGVGAALAASPLAFLEFLSSGL
jgi:hypothetical protein